MKKIKYVNLLTVIEKYNNMIVERIRYDLNDKNNECICVNSRREANLKATANTDTAVETKPLHYRTGHAGEHFASGVTLQDTNIMSIKIDNIGSY